MGRKNKVFGAKGQKETIDPLGGLSVRFIPCSRQKYADQRLPAGQVHI